MICQLLLLQMGQSMNSKKVNKLTVLSIDWDFCVPIHILNDWSAKEDFLFIGSIWNARKSFLLSKNGKINELSITEIKPDVNYLPTPRSRRAGIAESHSAAFEFITEIIDDEDITDVIIYNYDLHHDLWDYKKELLAANWLRALITEYKIRFNIMHVIPVWAEEQGHGFGAYSDKKYTRNLPEHATYQRVTADKVNFKFKDVDAVFICRSGGWVPPVLDKDFVTISYSLLCNLKDRNALEDVKYYCMGPFEPLKPRKL